MDNTVSIVGLELKNFRCFKETKFLFDAPIIFVHGDNGSGKTSILEALFYASNMRSFRGSPAKELAFFEDNSFFIKTHFSNNDVLQVGFADQKRRVRLNSHLITHHQELAPHYHALAIAQDDLNIVQESPEYRRLFIDQMLCQLYPELMPTFRAFRLALLQRNEYLSRKQFQDPLLYELLTTSLENHSDLIRTQRQTLLDQIIKALEPIQKGVFGSNGYFSFVYKAKEKGNLQQLQTKELRLGRSLIGCHLDDFTISIDQTEIRTFGSRGQQKAALLLLKIAQGIILSRMHPDSQKVFLIDDFITDFDSRRIDFFLSLLSTLKMQLFFTSPNPLPAITQTIPQSNVFNL
jgi:DNA replication and repair protein RecF